MKISKRNFLKTLSFCGCFILIVDFTSEQLPKKYHKITKDWSFSTGSVTNWNDFNIYFKVGLSENRDVCSHEMDNESEYVLRFQDTTYIYVNENKYYKIAYYKGEWIDNSHCLFEVKFDIIEYSGETPTERIIVISGSDYCIYALGRDYYKLEEKDFPPFGIRKGWTLDRREVFRPLTEEMHSKIKYFAFNRKTYREYLQVYNTKLKELNLI